MDLKCMLTFFIYGGSFVLFVIGFSIPYWLNSEGLHFGLWQVCTQSQCATITYLTDFWKATQALEIIGLIIAAGGLFLCFVGTFVKKETHQIKIFAGLAGIASAGCIMLGVIVFGAKTSEDMSMFNLHAGFALAIVSAVGLALSGILSIAIKSGTDESSRIMGVGGGTPGVIINPGH